MKDKIQEEGKKYKKYDDVTFSINKILKLFNQIQINKMLILFFLV